MKRIAARASVVVGSLAALLLGIAVSQAQMRRSGRVIQSPTASGS